MSEYPVLNKKDEKLMLTVEENNMKFPESIIDRRIFLKLSAIGAFSLIEFLSGCSIPKTFLKGDLAKYADGFELYNSANPNLKFPHGSWRTWYNLLKNWGYAHTGIQYSTGFKASFVACAAGTVISSHSKIGSGYDPNKRSGDYVMIDHGRGIQTVYYHMREGSRTVEVGDKINRGHILGYQGAPHGMHLKLYLLLDSYWREDSDNWGVKHSYMDYWDGKQELDFDYIATHEKLINQTLLIYKFGLRYTGPDAEKIHSPTLNFIHRGRNSKEDRAWSSIEQFKLTKYIFERHPELFEGDQKDIENLIAEIYANQPIILTLPFRKS